MVEQTVLAQSPAGTKPSTPMLECRDLRKSFGDLTAVDAVSFRIEPGETYGLLGPNGAGKTTAISMVVGVLEPDSGSLRVDGLAMHPEALDAKARIGYVPQDIALYPDLTGRENLRFFASLYRLDRRSAKQRAARRPRHRRVWRTGRMRRSRGTPAA